MNKYDWKEEFNKSIRFGMNYGWDNTEKDKDVIRKNVDAMHHLFYHSDHTMLGQELDELLISSLFTLSKDEFGILNYSRYLYKNNIQYEIIVVPINNKLAELRVYSSLNQAICVRIEFEDKHYTRVADFSLAINKAFKSLKEIK